MPTTLTFPLQPEQARVSPYPGRALHALFCQWLALADYSLVVKRLTHSAFYLTIRAQE